MSTPSDDAAGTVRQNPATKQTAIRTASPDAIRAWFVLDLVNGGWYSDGAECADWPIVHTPEVA